MTEPLIPKGQLPVLVHVDSLQEWPGNARKQDVEELAEAMKVYGFYGAVVVQKSTDRIIIGNHRWLAAKLAGFVSVPVHYVDCDDTMATRLNVWDNAVQDKGGYDPIARIAQLEALAASEEGLANSGFDEERMAQYILQNQEDELVDTDEEDIPMGSGDKPMYVECPNCHEEFDAKDHKIRPSENPY